MTVLDSVVSERIRRTVEDYRCDCGGEIVPHGNHERDSSRDYYECSSCGWRFEEHEYQTAMENP